MDTTPRRVSAWKLLPILSGTLIACLIALCLWVSIVADKKYAAMNLKAREMIGQVRNRDRSRPVLRGEIQPGNAWDDYHVAMDAGRKIKDAYKLGPIVDHSPKADREFGESALQSQGSILDHLRRGAGRAMSRFGFEWELGATMSVPHLLGCQHVTNLAILKARALLEEGRSRDSVALLLDVCQFGRDLGNDGPLICVLISQSILGTALAEAADLVHRGKLDPEALGDLERGLTLLDATFPRHDQTLSDEALLTGVSQLHEGSGNVWSRLLAADLFDRVTDWARRAGEAEKRSWAEAANVEREIATECLSGWNPLAKIVGPLTPGISRISRERRSQLRLLRVAARYQATGEVVTLDDPFGTQLKSSLADRTLRVWSVGQDGVDDGGVGEWNPAKGKDIVLVVER